MSTQNQDGSIAPLFLIVITIVVAACASLMRSASAVVTYARAQNAADAAALAGAVEGKDIADEIAHINGATLVSFENVQGVITTVVRIGSVKATASAVPTSVQ